MKIFIDIGHPAHVHYFKNLLNRLSGVGYEFVITARDKEMSHYLLKELNFNFYDRGKGAKALLGKIFYTFSADKQLYRLAKSEQPDLFLSFGSPYAAHVSFLLRKPHLVIDDTENATLGQFMYRPFSECILTPDCFKKDFGKKQIRFPSYMELSYLHPNVFTPDKSILNYLGINEDEKYTII